VPPKGVGIADPLSGTAKLYFSLRRIYLRIKHDPHRTEYTDAALTPVTDDEIEIRELFRSPAAQSYVSLEQRLDRFRRIPAGSAAPVAAEHAGAD
jgi:hypothetical protein